MPLLAVQTPSDLSTPGDLDLLEHPPGDRDLRLESSGVGVMGLRALGDRDMLNLNH